MVIAGCSLPYRETGQGVNCCWAKLKLNVALAKDCVALLGNGMLLQDAERHNIQSALMGCFQIDLRRTALFGGLQKTTGA